MTTTTKITTAWEKQYYARSWGRYYHIRECKLLAGKNFESLGYIEISMDEITRRKLLPCYCARIRK